MHGRLIRARTGPSDRKSGRLYAMPPPEPPIVNDGPQDRREADLVDHVARFFDRRDEPRPRALQPDTCHRLRLNSFRAIFGHLPDRGRDGRAEQLDRRASRAGPPCSGGPSPDTQPGLATERRAGSRRPSPSRARRSSTSTVSGSDVGRGRRARDPVMIVAGFELMRIGDAQALFGGAPVRLRARVVELRTPGRSRSSAPTRMIRIDLEDRSRVARHLHIPHLRRPTSAHLHGSSAVRQSADAPGIELGAGPTVVLIHGTPSPAADLLPLADSISHAGFRVTRSRASRLRRRVRVLADSSTTSAPVARSPLRSAPRSTRSSDSRAAVIARFILATRCGVRARWI